MGTTNTKHETRRYFIDFLIRSAIVCLLLPFTFTILAPLPPASSTSTTPALKADGSKSASSKSTKEKRRELEKSYKQAWQLIRDNTLFPHRLKNWDRWENKYAGKLKTPADLEKAIAAMLDSLGDQYTYFRNVVQNETFHERDEQKGVVSHKTLANNVGYIAISGFSSQNTADELENALKELQSSKGLIIDLRGNKGGYVEQAVECYGLLAEKGKFISIRGRQEGKKYYEDILLEKDGIKRTIDGAVSRESRRPNLSGEKSMLVLVDEETRSAAEMLAGALKDNKRAKVAGCRTYGKGLVQNTWDIEPSCSLRITIARYFLPSGKCINGEGIAPDINVKFEASKQSESDDALDLRSRQISEMENLLPDLIPNLL